jgi:lysophospholipase L1-like esterase
MVRKLVHLVAFLFSIIAFIYLISCRSAPDIQPGRIVILAIGDSITQGDAVKGANDLLSNQFQGGWVSLLEGRLERDYPGVFQVVNLGINGDTVLGVEDRLIEALDRYRPQHLILGIGTNDVYGDKVLLPGIATGIPSPDLDSFTTNFKTILRILAKEGPQSILLLGISTPIRAAWFDSPIAFMIDMPEQESIKTKVDSFNTVIATEALRYRFSYLDTESLWPENWEKRREYFADGLHPNTDGYQRLYQAIFEALDPIFQKNTSNP